MIKVTVEYLVDEKELEKELEIIRRAYTEALKNKNLAINTLLNYSIISNEEAEEMRIAY